MRFESNTVTWVLQAAGHWPLLGDVGPGPLVPLMGGSAVIAGVFLSLAIVTGGIWLARRLEHREAPTSRKLFWVSLGGAALFAAVPAGIIGLFVPPLLVIAAALVVTGVCLVVLGCWPSRGSRVDPDVAADQSGDGSV